VIEEEQTMSDLLGQYLGRYHIREQLGEGGMATVYKAYDTRLERSIAIKVIRAEKTNAPSFLARFEREARALAQLSHSNIVKVLDYGEHEGMPFLVMEYIPGGTLKQALKAPLPYQEAAKLIAPVARALEYAHQRKIIHRDIKPANILMNEMGQPMLSDFGIAKLMEADDREALTGTGVGMGTPEYMAPEQGSGAAKVDQRADIYSLGIVFYEMITGRKPFQADTPLAVVYKQVNDPLPSPRLYIPGLPDSVERVLIKVLAKDPEDRYQSMAAFADALENLAAGNPQVTVVTSPPEIGETFDSLAQPGQLSQSTPGRKPRKKVVVILLIIPGIIIVCCLILWLMYLLNICPPPGPWPAAPWCGVDISAETNRLVCPPPGPWPTLPWCK
jgi:serine/threonine protein kinase